MIALTRLIAAAMADLKAAEIHTYHVAAITTITDHIVIGSGRSARQVTAIADKILEAAKRQGHRPLGVEGRQQAEWILIDFGDVIAHIMQPATREYYQLEKLWDFEPKIGAGRPDDRTPPDCA